MSTALNSFASIMPTRSSSNSSTWYLSFFGSTHSFCNQNIHTNNLKLSLPPARLQTGAGWVHEGGDPLDIDWLWRQPAMHWSHWGQAGCSGPSGWGVQGKQTVLLPVQLLSTGESLCLEVMSKAMTKCWCVSSSCFHRCPKALTTHGPRNCTTPSWSRMLTLISPGYQIELSSSTTLQTR